MAYQLSDKELKGIVETIRSNVKKTESTPKQPSEAYKALQEYKTNGPEKTETIQTRGKTNAQKLDVQKKKEDRIEEKTETNSEEIRKDRTKKQHEDYFKALGAKRKELTDSVTGVNAIQNNPYGYNPELAQEVNRMAQQERVLRARAEQAEKKYNEAEDRKLFEADMAVITGLPENKRKALERYSTGKHDASYIEGDTHVEDMLAKYGKERMDELEETLTRSKNKDLAKLVDEKSREFVNKRQGRGILANAATIPVNAFSGLVGSTAQLANMLTDTGRYKTLDPYAGTVGDTFTNAVRGQTSENILTDLGDGFVGQAANIGYQATMAAADSVARAYLGGGSLGGATLAGTGAFSQTMAEASRNGATPAEAAMLATTSAFVELAAEKIPLDNLIKTAGGEAGKSVIKSILTQAGIEIAEEEITLLANVFLEAAILQEKSDYNQTVNKYIMEGGMTPEEAAKQADMDILNEAINTALVSGLSGTMSAVSAEGYNRRNESGTLDTTPKTAEELKQQALDKVKAIDEQNQTPAAEPVQAQQEQQTAPVEPEAAVAENATADKTEAVTPEQQKENVRKAIGDAMFAKGAEMAGKQEKQTQPKQNKTEDQKRATAETAHTVQPKKEVASEQQTPIVKIQQATQKATAQRTTQEQKPTQVAESPKISNTVTKKEDSKKGKPVYMEYNDFAPNNTYFGPKALSNSDAASDVSFTFNDDGTLDLKVNESNNTYNTISGYKTRGYMYYYDIYVNGKKVNDANEVSGYYSMKNAEVDKKPVLREIPGGNMLLKEKGKLHFYSDDFQKPIRQTNTEKTVEPATEQPQQFAPTQKETKNEKRTQKNAQETNYTDDDLWFEDDADDMEWFASSVPKNKQTPEIKGTGAAEQNFTGKAAYQNLLSEDNVQRDRPTDTRPMEVPKTDSFGKHVSELVSNAYGAEVTTDKMANTIEELVQEGALGFDVRHNQDSINKAAKQIAQNGVDATRRQITKAVSKRKIRDGDVEQAILLYAMYNSKDTDTAMDKASGILVDLATMANITGRNLQMFRMLRQMTPEGQVMTIQKQVQKNIDSMIQYGAVKKGYTTEIDPELMQEYRKAAQENMRAVSESQKKASAEKMQTIMDAIYAIEASKMPATMKAKWDAWRYMSMLGNAKTNVRNVLGNTLFVPYKQVKDRTAALAEKLFVSKDKRTKSLFTDPELLKWARQDRITDDVKSALKYSGKIGEDVTTEKIRENMKVFDNKTLESIRKLTEKMPQAGDMWFKNGYYARSLADFMRSRGYKASDITSGKVSAEVLNEARSYAVQEAMKATFNDANAVSDFLATGIRYKGDNPVGKLWNIAMEGVMPFRRTPANIAVRFEEYSPLGIINTMWKAVDPLKTGKYTAADVVDSLASSLTGTAAMALGFVLAKGLAGIKLTGSNPSEDEERQGHQEYAIEFADKDGNEYSYKIDWAAPSNLPLFVGANIYDAIANNGENDDVSKFTAFLRGLGNAFEPMLALSCLSGINDALESVRYAEEGEELYTLAAEIATGYFSQGIPALLRQAAQASQEVKRSTFSESTDPTIRDIEGTLSNVPFYGDKFKTDKVNQWGETVKQGEATAEFLNISENASRAIDAFINPGTLKKIDNGALEQEIKRLNKAQPESVSPPVFSKVVSYTDKDGTFHDKHRMTEEEYQKLAQTQGQTAKAILESMISSKSYAAINDEQKAKAIKMAYSYAREKAMGETFDTSFSESWMMDIKSGKEAAQILQNTADNALSNAFSKLDTAWDNNYSQANTENYSRELEKAYESYSKMEAADKRIVKETATGSAAKYIEAREKGISHADFVSTAKSVNNVKGSGKNGTVRDIDKRQAIAKTPGLTTSETDRLMKVYMPDYDPNDESPETTEFKYQYIREELGLSPQEYASTYRAYLDNAKKNQRIKAIQALGYDYSTARKLYNVYYGNMKKQLIEMYG